MGLTTMKLGDKEIKTGLEVGRSVRALSTTQKIEEKIRQEVIEKYGKILSPYEIQQITGKEKERQEKRKASLERSRINILKMKDKAMLIQDIRRAIQAGTLFKRREKPKREEKSEEVIEETTEITQPTVPQSDEQRQPSESEERISQEEVKKGETQSKPNIKPVDFEY